MYKSALQLLFLNWIILNFMNIELLTFRLIIHDELL